MPRADQGDVMSTYMVPTGKTPLSGQVLVLVMILTGCSQLSEPESTRTAYECDSGRTIHVPYTSDELAIVEYRGRTIRLTSAVSASGARYIGEDLEWWTKGSSPGSEGILSSKGAGGAGEIMESCVESAG